MVNKQSEEALERKAPQTKKLMLLIIIISAVFMGVTGTGFYILWSKVAPPDPEGTLEYDTIKKKAGVGKIRPVFTLDTFVVNLADRGASRYLRTTLDLELTDEATIEEVKQRLPQIRNAILMIIPSKTSKDIRTTDGKTAMRDEIMEKLNAFMKSGSITNIYFTEFVIQ
jgi:flagellar FliL protein